MPYRTAPPPEPPPESHQPSWLCRLVGHLIAVGEVVPKPKDCEVESTLIRTICPRCGSHLDPRENPFLLPGTLSGNALAFGIPATLGSHTHQGFLKARVGKNGEILWLLLDFRPHDSMEPGWDRVFLVNGRLRLHSRWARKH